MKAIVTIDDVVVGEVNVSDVNVVEEGAIVVSLNGRQLARVIVPHLGPAVRALGVGRSADIGVDVPGGGAA